MMVQLVIFFHENEPCVNDAQNICNQIELYDVYLHGQLCTSISGTYNKRLNYP
jgi:hypothetical protein